MEDQEKLKALRGIVIASIVVISVLGVLLVMDNYKLMKVQNVYVQGYNKCAQMCNSRLDLYRARCSIMNPVENESIPFIEISIGVVDNNSE